MHTHIVERPPTGAVKRAMRVAVVHHLPTGGAIRVMAEWLVRTRAEKATIYTRDAAVHDFVSLPANVSVVEQPLHEGTGVCNEAIRLKHSARDGRQLAEEIDAQEHDVVFCFASMLTQAIDVLPFLRTPSLYYAPEPLRSAYESKRFVQLEHGLRPRIAHMALRPLELYRRRLDRRYIRSARHIVTHSHFTQRMLREIYEVDSQIVRLGVDINAFTPGPDHREPWVLSVGALHPLKGHDQLIEALSTLPLPRPRLIVVGDRGQYEHTLRQLAHTREVEMEVRSKLPFAELVSLYQRASVVACAHVREPFGLVPLEAMACATPVVAVADGGFRETISNGKTGVLVNRDPYELGQAIAGLLADKNLAARLGTQGRKVVERDWAWDRTATEFDDLLEQLGRL